mmetsp:Transcript_57533/g.186748  ORF Transcript_57533/g.186748 Transcript_57533/m.186748 type:complete len:211 (+) Transcript_57533:213-845(+)
MPQEEVDSLALADGFCSGGPGQRCAFARTSGRRLVEVRHAEGTSTQDSNGLGSPSSEDAEWFPTRIVQGGDGEGKGQSAQQGALRLLGASDHQYLGLLTSHSQESSGKVEQHLEVLDPSTGAPVGAWLLPRAQYWSSFCTARDEIFLLATDGEPQIWRFPLPATAFSQKVEQSAAPSEGAAGAHRKRHRLALRSSFRKSAGARATLQASV